MKLNKFSILTLIFVSSLTSFHMAFASENEDFPESYSQYNSYIENNNYQEQNEFFEEIDEEIIEKDYSDVSAYENFINYKYMNDFDQEKVKEFEEKLTNIFEYICREYNSYPEGDYKQANRRQKNNFQRKLETTISLKLKEYKNNKLFCQNVEDEIFSNKRKKWKSLFSKSSELIQKVREEKFPLKELKFIQPHNSIYEKWGDHTFKAYDISGEDYSFLIHTVDFIPEKSELLSNYIVKQDSFHMNIPGKSNFDICPLLSTSVINKNTGGYTDNIDFAPCGFPIHLILSVDPRSIARTEVSDAFSPAKRSISNYLNKIPHKIKGGDEMQKPQDFVNYFSDSLTDVNKFYSPKKLLNKTFSPHNEVIVVGNPYICFFKNSQPIQVIGVGISKYWFDLAPQYPRFKESAKKLEDFLEKTKLPLVYYDPKTPTTAWGSYLSGKGNFKNMKKLIQGEVQWGREEDLIYIIDPSEKKFPQSVNMESLMEEYNSFLEKRKKVLSNDLDFFKKREDLTEAIQELKNEIKVFHEKLKDFMKKK